MHKSKCYDVIERCLPLDAVKVDIVLVGNQRSQGKPLCRCAFYPAVDRVVRVSVARMRFAILNALTRAGRFDGAGSIGLAVRKAVPDCALRRGAPWSSSSFHGSAEPSLCFDAIPDGKSFHTCPGIALMPERQLLSRQWTET